MLRIKLSRFGRKGQPVYRIVVTEKRSKRDGKYVEQVGFYNPMSKEVRFENDLYDKWISQGAQPTDTVRALYTKHTTKNK